MSKSILQGMMDFTECWGPQLSTGPSWDRLKSTLQPSFFHWAGCNGFLLLSGGLDIFGECRAPALPHGPHC